MLYSNNFCEDELMSLLLHAAICALFYIKTSVTILILLTFYTLIDVFILLLSLFYTSSSF